jgi:hypothetical protein
MADSTTPRRTTRQQRAGRRVDLAHRLELAAAIVRIAAAAVAEGQATLALLLDALARTPRQLCQEIELILDEQQAAQRRVCPPAPAVSEASWSYPVAACPHFIHEHIWPGYWGDVVSAHACSHEALAAGITSSDAGRFPAEPARYGHDP